MLDKIKTGFNWTIIFIFLIAFIYFIIISIINMLSPTKDSELTDVNQKNVDIYMTNSNIVKNYSTFFNVETIIQNIILNLNKGNYNEVYSTLSYEEKNNISKKYFTSNIEEYINNNFKYNVFDEMDRVGYENYSNLKMLYSINKDEYIAVVTSTNTLKETKIGIKLINNSKYLITYLEL